MQNAFNMSLLELIKLKKCFCCKNTFKIIGRCASVLEEIPFKHMFL